MASFGRVWRRVVRAPRTRASMWVLVVASVGIGVGVGAVVWRGSGDTKSRRDQFVDAYASGLAGTAIADDDPRCWARAAVEAIGATKLAEATSLDATRANPALVASELGITVSDSQGERFYEALSDCTNPRLLFVALMDDVEAECFNQRIDDALLRELVVAWFTSAAEIGPDLDAALTDLHERCPTETTGGQPQPPMTNIASLRNAQQGGPSVKVITYNTYGLLRDEGVKPQWHVDSDPRQFTQVVGDEVAGQRADFVLLQEVCGSQAELIAQRSSLLGHPMSVITVTEFGKKESRYRDAVRVCEGSSWPLDSPVPYGKAILANPGASPIDPPPGYPAQCIRAGSPQPVRVCNVHSPAGDARLVTQFGNWTDEPLILGGDFNTTPLSAPVASLYGGMHEAAGPNNTLTALNPSAWTVFTPVPYKRIDHIFADKLNFDGSSGADVLSPRCDGYKHCSDHSMVVGELILSSAGPSPFPRQIDPSLHGGSAWAVYLAVTDSYDDPSILEAKDLARSVGYDAAAGDLGCDVGAAAALGRNPEAFAAAVAVYFDSESSATLARDLFERREIPVVGVASVSVLCLDEGG